MVWKMEMGTLLLFNLYEAPGIYNDLNHGPRSAGEHGA